MTEGAKCKQFLVGNKVVELEFGRSKSDKQNFYPLHWFREKHRRSPLLGTAENGLEQRWGHGDCQGWDRAFCG